MPTEAERFRALTEAAKSLSETVAELTNSVTELWVRSKRQKLGLIVGLAGLFADLVLSVVVITVLHDQDVANAQLAEAIVQQKELVSRQETVRSEVLCPLYALIVGSYNPTSRAAGENRAQYEAGFTAMRNQYRALNCSIAPIPPAQPPR